MHSGGWGGPPRGVQALPQAPKILSGPPQGPGPPAVPEHAPLVPVPPTLGFMRHMRRRPLHWCMIIIPAPHLTLGFMRHMRRRPLHWFSIAMYSLRPMPMTCTISAACTQG